MAGRSRRPVLVSDVLARLLDEKTGPSGVSGPRFGAGGVSRVLSAFGRIGPPVTEHADAVDFRRGVLTLQVHESAWLTELTFLRTEIIDRVNRMVGKTAVKEVRLRLGPRRKAMSAPPPPKPLTAQQRAAVDEWTAPIADNAVREAVRRAAARCLGVDARPPPAISGPPGPRLRPRDPEPPSLSYGYGDREGAERPGWTKDRWQAKKRGGPR